MSTLPDIPLSPEAKKLLTRIKPRILEGLEEVNKIPVSVLLWGPGMNSTSPLAAIRANLRSELRKMGHAAFYSEELCDPNSPHSIRMQQLVQAQQFDLVVSIPCTVGAVGEVHDFASDRRITSKMLVFLNELDLNGYSPQSLQAISTIISCRLEYYPSENDTTPITEITFDTVQRVREMKYMLTGRNQI